jgi:hypothetical protein
MLARSLADPTKQQVRNHAKGSPQANLRFNFSTDKLESFGRVSK